MKERVKKLKLEFQLTDEDPEVLKMKLEKEQT